MAKLFSGEGKKNDDKNDDKLIFTRFKQDKFDDKCKPLSSKYHQIYETVGFKMISLTII